MIAVSVGPQLAIHDTKDFIDVLLGLYIAYKLSWHMFYPLWELAAGARVAAQGTEKHQSA
jgi:hypothetical protein